MTRLTCPKRSEEEVAHSVFGRLQDYWGDLKVLHDNGYEITFTSKSVGDWARRRAKYVENGPRLERFFFEPHIQLGLVAPSPYLVERESDETRRTTHVNDVRRVRLSIALDAPVLKAALTGMQERALRLGAEELGRRIGRLRDGWMKGLWERTLQNCNYLGQGLHRENRPSIPTGYLYGDVLVMCPEDEGAAVFWPAVLLEQRVDRLEAFSISRLLEAYRNRAGVADEDWAKILPSPQGELLPRSDPISAIAAFLEYECVVRRRPRDEEELFAWRDSPELFFQQGIKVGTLRRTHDDLLHDALVEWRRIQEHAMRCCLLSAARLGDNTAAVGESDDVGHVFDLWFAGALRSGASRGLRAGAGMAHDLRPVMNMGWVDAFAVHLPQAVEAPRRREMAIHGRRVAALFWLECFSRGSDEGALRRCAAAWNFASALAEPPAS